MGAEKIGGPVWGSGRACRPLASPQAVGVEPDGPWPTVGGEVLNDKPLDGQRFIGRRQALALIQIDFQTREVLKVLM